MIDHQIDRNAPIGDFLTHTFADDFYSKDNFTFFCRSFPRAERESDQGVQRLAPMSQRNLKPMDATIRLTMDEVHIHPL